MVQPESRYARSGDVYIAYQVTGDGPVDLIWVKGWVTHLEYDWEHPPQVHCFRRLASFSRLIRLDKRGTGLSDRVSLDALPTLEQRMDDIRAVMDAVGSERAVLMGSSEGGQICLLFAATYPERTAALVLFGTFPKTTKSPDYLFGSHSADPEERERYYAEIAQSWGRVNLARATAGPADDRRYQEWNATAGRLGASPGAAIALLRMTAENDVRHVLPAIRVPTLVVNRIGDPLARIEGARLMAEQIPGAKFVELPGDAHAIWVGDADSVLDEIEEFVTGTRPATEPDRVLATVLFTDIVGSTAQAAALGDQCWHDLLRDHHTAVRRELARFRGREIHTTGDGFLATFDGPARAIRCATAIVAAVHRLGIEVRAGLHTGEVELMDDDIGGIAVHIGARIADQATAGEVLVSSTVKDLVAGSGVVFVDRGARALRGVPDQWHLFSVDRAETR
jgi:pimeloyl-ACP methyl ester carboxylesterase